MDLEINLETLTSIFSFCGLPAHAGPLMTATIAHIPSVAPSLIDSFAAQLSFFPISLFLNWMGESSSKQAF